MYDTATGAGVRFLRLPFTQYSPAPVPAASLIATFGFCADNGIANVVTNKTATPIERKIIFTGFTPFQRFGLRVTNVTRVRYASFTTFRRRTQEKWSEVKKTKGVVLDRSRDDLIRWATTYRITPGSGLGALAYSRLLI